MTVLHICNDYLGSKVHHQLYSHLSILGLKQIVYVPTRSSTVSKSLQINKELGYDIVFSKVLYKYHSLLFELKSKYLFKDILAKIDISQIDVIHATTLFSDGILAFKLAQKFKISYVVTVRSTDVAVFLKYRPDLIYLALKIMKEAKQVIFVNKNIKDKLFSRSKFEQLSIENKIRSEIIPNGVDQFWIDNAVSSTRKLKNKEFINILYIGTFLKRKNVHLLINAVRELYSQKNNIRLLIVGGGGGYQQEILNLINDNRSIVEYFGIIKEKTKILDIFRKSHIFAMPSVKETFGLVYIEALLQGLPILYTKDEGIDGFYDDKIGEKVSPVNTQEIKRQITKLTSRYNEYNIDIDRVKMNHSWELIAKRYLEMYKNL